MLGGRQLEWRQVTLTAVDTAGARTSVTRSVPLRPVVAPNLNARVRRHQCPGAGPGPPAPAGAEGRRGCAPAGADIQNINHPLTTNDVLAFDASASSDASGKIAYYTLEVGRPQAAGTQQWPRAGYKDCPALIRSIRRWMAPAPGEIFSGPLDAGAGLGLVAAHGNLAV